MLEPLLGREIEINSHIYQKPLGYPGDYAVQNYILDYHKGQYLGKTTYQKLINYYTCNIPIAKSNVKRKDFLKTKISDTLDSKNRVRILSVASGPLRELIELVREGKIDRPLQFTCVDFEERTLQYVKSEMNGIESEKKRLLEINYIRQNISGLIRDKTFSKEVGGQDLVYSAGLFDYLNDRLATKFVQILYSLVDKNGTLIICNASSKNSSVRSYYELLGDWVFYHRTKEDLLAWVHDIKTSHEIKFDAPVGGEGYLYLHVKK